MRKQIPLTWPTISTIPTSLKLLQRRRHFCAKIKRIDLILSALKILFKLFSITIIRDTFTVNSFIVTNKYVLSLVVFQHGK